jgi:signal transduction histidine kinase
VCSSDLTKQQGVGIGLSISQSIVESHGGVIRVDNGFAGGAIFRVWLPVRDGEAR